MSGAPDLDMESVDRDQLISDVKALQKLTRNLERASNKIGTSGDTTSWRRTFNDDVERGLQLVLSLQSTEDRVRAASIDAQADKLLQQSRDPIDKFNKLKQDIDARLRQHEPINNDPAYDDDGGNAYGGGADYGYSPPQQEQEQSYEEQIDLVPLAADIDHLEEKNRAVKKIADDVQQLNEAFTDLNTLVTEQGDQITHIENNTATAKEQVQAGVVHIETAERHQISARKKQCIFLCICLVLLGVIFGIIFGVPGITRKK